MGWGGDVDAWLDSAGSVRRLGGRASVLSASVVGVLADSGVGCGVVGACDGGERGGSFGGGS